jgi:hypothetical protein
MRNLAGLDIAGLNERLNSLITRIDLRGAGLKMERDQRRRDEPGDLFDRVVNSPDLTNSLADLRPRSSNTGSWRKN